MACSVLTRIGLGTFLWLSSIWRYFGAYPREGGPPFPNVNMFVVVSALL